MAERYFCPPVCPFARSLPIPCLAARSLPTALPLVQAETLKLLILRVVGVAGGQNSQNQGLLLLPSYFSLIPLSTSVIKMTTSTPTMNPFAAAGGFLDLANHRIAIAAIEAVHFTTNVEAQMLHIQVSLKSGKEVQTFIACSSGVNPLTGKKTQNTPQAIEHAIRAAIVLEPQN